ncbi:SAM-dependent methyltransferase [Microvirga lupini]|uniref:SAM-dependent methyltransferase n=1 Tax=Microvirga lupini TaxID=420324 RepID=A0A7W4VKK6_9HYPH|nr:class I SAM-dependent methyltransferase [Microvirga lupini]MBB3018929.1 SAM-dependent methyltransferase [Microvirga lupini]
MPNEPGLWGAGESYERYMGRWSREVAPRFVDWLAPGPGGACVDIGCGTGIVTSALLERAAPARIVGIDSAPGFLELARTRVSDPRAAFKEGNALALPEADDAFDFAVSGLVLNFLPDKAAALAEMARVVRPGGLVGLYVWDYAGHMQIMRHFFDVAAALDPRALDFDDGVKAPVCRPGPLRELLAGAGLEGVEVRAIDIAAAFESFEDYWTPFLGGTGSAPKYCMSLTEPAREELRERLRARLPTGPDGEILLAVRAWAAKGRVAG